ALGQVQAVGARVEQRFAEQVQAGAVGLPRTASADGDLHAARVLDERPLLVERSADQARLGDVPATLLLDDGDGFRCRHRPLLWVVWHQAALGITRRHQTTLAQGTE